VNDVQIKHFIELAKCLNFTKAAQNLYIAQPALSRSIAKMEKELGLILFARNKKNVRLTPAGIVMMEGYQKLLKDHNNLLEKATIVGKGESGSLTVGIIECQNTDFYLPKIVEFFCENYPGIQIEMYYDSFKALRQKLESGEADIVITQLFDLSSDINDEIIYEIFADTPGRCIVYQKHPLAQYEEVNADNLNGEMMIIISQDVSNQGYNEALNYVKYHNIEVGGIRTAETLQNVMLMVENGLGFAFWDCISKINRDCVKLLPIKDNIMLSLVAVWRKENYNTAIPIFMDCLLKATESISKKLQ
jgi:DNA-binding transcriptional LysR family regulator